MDEVLYEAARLIDSTGHCKGAFETIKLDGGVASYCIEGAIRKVVTGQACLDESDLENITPYVRKVAKVIDPEACDPHGTVYDYNDNPERSAAECVKVLMEAAELGE